VGVDAPIALCDHHLAVAADWAAREQGVTDVLPMPCRLCGSRVGVRFPSGWVCAVCDWRAGELIDHELPAPRVDVVYYLRYADRIKIGTTAKPRQRLAVIMHDELLAFERGDRVLERARHAQFAGIREGGEWFTATPELRAHAAMLADGIDPWSRYARWVAEALR